MTPAVEAEQITYAYGSRRALDSFSVTIPEGSVFGLLGPNGCGKSTFVTLVAAMRPQQPGVLRIFGQEPHAGLRARVGTVFQENTADPLMTVSETLRLAGRLFGLSGQALASRMREGLVLFGLAERERDPVSSLSGGMRRRLEMCRALLHNPDLLLLDEPTTGVDPDERRVLWEGLIGRRDGRRTILIATNDLVEADAICDQVAFMQAGRVIATGAPSALKQGLKRDAVRLEWPSPTPEQVQQLRDWMHGDQVVREGDIMHLTVDDASGFIPRAFEIAEGAIRSVTIDRASLEDAYFRHVAGRNEARG